MSISFPVDNYMSVFWGYVQTLLYFSSPFVMISVAIMAAGMLLFIIITSFKKAGKEKYKDEDDDYEVKHY